MMDRFMDDSDKYYKLIDNFKLSYYRCIHDVGDLEWFHVDDVCAIF